MIKWLLTALLVTTSGFAWGQETKCKASLSDDNALKNGNNYKQVVETVGCEGAELSATEMAGFKSVMYMWSGDGSLGANMSLMFKNGRLLS